MTLVWTRVDQKLIHGQISVSWVPHLNADVVVVVDQDTAEDPWAQKVMSMGLPPEVRAPYFISPMELAGLLRRDELESGRVLVIFKSVEDVMEASEAGFRLERLNLGNQVFDGPGRKVRLADSFYVSLSDLDFLSRLQAAGLEVVVQAVPGSKSIKWRAE